MFCYDTDSHEVIHVSGVKAREVKGFGLALGAVRNHDKGNGEICVPINAKKILKFRITLDQYPEEPEPKKSA